MPPSASPPFPADPLPVPGELTVARPVPAPPPPPPAVVPVPAGWLLAHGDGPIQAWVLRELLGTTVPARLPYGSRLGWHLLALQDGDGSWPGGLLAVPSGGGVAGVGTIPAYRALLELGWDAESPGMARTKRLLFRLLAEDRDPTLLAELRPADDDEDLVLRGRLIVREAAAAALAQAGYEADPRLRGAARRLIDRVGAFLRSPLAAKPWVRVGNQHVLAADAAPPSFHLLVMLAYMPQFRSEHAVFMEQLRTWLTAPWPRQAAVQQVAGQLLDQPHLALGDFLETRGALDGDMPSALAWLEIMARLGFLRGHEGWERLLDRTLDDRGRRAIWTPPRSVVMPAVVPSWSWPTLPLGVHGPGEDGAEASAATATALSVGVTWRLALIARLAGREIDLLPP